LRAAGLLAKRGADVVITSRSKESAARAETTVNRRFDVGVRGVAAGTAPALQGALDGAALILNAGPPGVQLLPQRAWAGRPGLKAAADVNAVPPLGIEGIEPNDDAALKHGVRCLGALAIGKLKMRVHRACLERLFERNDLVLDAETIEEVARGLS
jgi:hypothetical protein